MRLMGWILLWVAVLEGPEELAASQASRSTPDLEHECYVWQRAWTDPVRRAVSERGTNFTRLVVLGGEITWAKQAPEVVLVDTDDAALARTGRPIGLAWRVGPLSGALRADDPRLDRLKTALHGRLQRARRSGLRLAELQIDFDCASAQLRGYRTWIESLRREFAPLPLTFTALPTWIGEPGFEELVRAADGFVLQVHSLRRPASIETPFTLCDPATALRDVERVGRLGVPFRVALPTYGYLCAFDARGRFIGLSAEGPRPEWPEGTQLKEVRTDPGEMAGLFSRWARQRPPSLQGIIWYRLPVEGDRLNWAWPTLDAVQRGTPLQADLQTTAETKDSLLFEIDLRNRGTAAAIHRTQILVRWRGGRLVAADGLAGFVVEDMSPTSLRISYPTGSFRWEPGRRQRVGWLRFSKPTEVSLEVSTLHR